MTTQIQLEVKPRHDLRMDLPVSELVDRFKSLWWECSLQLPDLGPTFSLSEQRSREALFEQYLRVVNSALERAAGGEEAREKAQATIRDTTFDFMKSTLDFTETDLDALRSYGFAEVVAEFTRQARDFDPHIRDEDLFQASRNVWSMNFLQLLLGIPIELTPAIFAYSMLYPYTDNYLDDPRVLEETKTAFNRRFTLRLAGENISPANPQEATICELVGMIEGQFERASFPQIYASLLAIHRAQGKSVSLLRKRFSPFEVDVLGICFEKGGTSVLADGYLVNGTLSEAQQAFMFYYGTLTQLVDDLEDVGQDLSSGLMTVFSYTAQHWPLDEITSRTFNFSAKVLEVLDDFEAPPAEPLKKIIHRSITPLLIGEVGSVSRYYTRSYLQVLEPHSPFRFSFIRKQRANLSKRGLSLVGLIEALAAPQLC